MPRRRGAVLVPLILLSLSLLTGAGCGGPGLQFADWVDPLPGDGVAVLEYAGVPYEERTGNEIEVVDDLALGEALNPEEAFYQPTYVDTDAAGNIFVLDRGDPRIQVFDPEGTYLRTMGREGQGPGEFAQPAYLTVTADHVVLRADTRRLSTWTLDGEHLGDVQLTDPLLTWMGFEGGFIARRTIREEPETPAEAPAATSSFSAYDAFGEPIEFLVGLQEPPPMRLSMPGGGTMIMSGGPIADWGIRAATARDGSFYVGSGTEYQLHAFGSRPWSLRVAWPREPVTGEHIDAVKDRFAASEGMLSQIDLSSIKWPDHHVAVMGIDVDGHGHLYVYPFHLPLHRPLGPDEERPDVPRLVDVYSPAGELLFNGLIDLGGWISARGDFVYATRANAETDETEVVRYRLVEPF